MNTKLAYSLSPYFSFFTLTRFCVHQGNLYSQFSKPCAGTRKSGEKQKAFFCHKYIYRLTWTLLFSSKTSHWKSDQRDRGTEVIENLTRGRQGEYDRKELGKGVVKFKKVRHRVEIPALLLNVGVLKCWIWRVRGVYGQGGGFSSGPITLYELFYWRCSCLDF